MISNQFKLKLKVIGTGLDVRGPFQALHGQELGRRQNYKTTGLRFRKVYQTGQDVVSEMNIELHQDGKVTGTVIDYGAEEKRSVLIMYRVGAAKMTTARATSTRATSTKATTTTMKTTSTTRKTTSTTTVTTPSPTTTTTTTSTTTTTTTEVSKFVEEKFNQIMYDGPAQFPLLESISKDVTIGPFDFDFSCPRFVRFPFYMGQCQSRYGPVEIRGRSETPVTWKAGNEHSWILMIAEEKMWCEVSDTMLSTSLSRNSK